jgi:hypothetical protein
MKVTRTIVFSLYALMISAIPTYAKEWRGIIPMKSTCEDVKRILGVTTCNPPDEIYDLGDEKVRIEFTKYPCHRAYTKFWDVPVGTVIIIERYLKKPITIAELGVDVSKYEIATTDMIDMNIYSSEEEGMSFYALKDQVREIFYMPTKEDSHLQCSPEKLKALKAKGLGKS